MSVTHPIGDEWLVSYASGALSEGAGILVASHVALCDQSADRLRDAELIGGALMENIDGAAISSATRARVLSGLDEAAIETGVRPDASASPESDLPPALEHLLGGGLDAVHWGFLGPGLKKAKIWSANGETLWLLRAKPGATLPQHGHNGTELTLVLKGAFRDATGRYGVGDVEEADEDLEHEITVEEGEECVCLALTQGKLRLKGLIARAMQPFIGM